jgi:hypothetical protein
MICEHHTVLISRIFQSWCTRHDGGRGTKNHFVIDTLFCEQPPKTEKPE